MSAADIARALGGKRITDGFICRCPVPGHGKGQGDRNPSLLVKDGERAPLFRCFAGCDARDVLDVLRRRGLADEGAGQHTSAPVPWSRPAVHEPDPEALKIWREAKAGVGTLAEQYLRSRCISIAIPPSLRCGTCFHLDRYEMLTMVAGAQGPDGRVIAIQRTLLTPTGRKAPVSSPRITTGALGAGAVRLAKAGDVLGIAEGVETALAAMQLSGVSTWACLGAARMHRVEIPADVRELHIFADNDEPGRAAAARTAHTNRHRRVVLRFPPHGCKDWNDAVALARAAA
jgi:putative DNA primase/helicase